MGFNSFEFADQVCFSLIGNLDTEARGNETLNIWTNTTATLNQNWQMGPSSQTDIINNILVGPATDPADYESYMAGTYPGSNNFEDPNQYCAKDITLLLQCVAKFGDFSSGGAGSTQMSEVQQFGNLVSATQQIQTSNGDTETKAEASYLQQTTSSGQTQADMGNSAIGILSTIASLTMQSFL
jgi:hypothetical protein